ncbi:hypothetical protein FQN57_000686 [Myotisia sp. PD_48]|nr:hypothetical protein FQN57_000686 [Myotisia sp. PD_48]
MEREFMERTLDVHASKLGDASYDIARKHSSAVEIRDTLEQLCSGPTYAIFLAKLWPVFKKILKGDAVFSTMSYEHKLRNCILEIIHRLPLDLDAVGPYASDMVDLLIELVRHENEDNAVICMKTIMDLMRRRTRETRPSMQTFLELIHNLFEGMPQVVKETFELPATTTTAGPGMPSTPNATAQNFQSPRPSSPAASVSDLGPDQQGNQQLVRGMQSFKVLAECPIIVVSIFQIHRSSVSSNIGVFVPLIKGILLLQAKPQERAHSDAAAQGKIFAGVSKDIKNRTAFGEFITAQVKTMSFLAYLLRVHSNHLQDFLPSLPGVVVRLLQDCPREKSSVRKELLVAIRHIINFNYRKIFLEKLDDLLDERTLIGDGLTVHESLRALAYSMLADLIHHVRESLTRDQILRTIQVYTKNLHDEMPGTSFQAMSAKLLLNMAEKIASLEDKREARYFLIMILDAIGDKFAAMNHEFHNAIKLSKKLKEFPNGEDETYLADKDHPPDWDDIDIFSASPIKVVNPRDRNADPVSDNKFLFKTLVSGAKGLFYQMKACNPTDIKIDSSYAPINWAEVSFGYNAEEVRVIRKLFHEGAAVFKYYGVDNPDIDAKNSSPLEFLASQYMQQMGKEEKDLLESFGTIFHYIDTATFHEIFDAEIGHLHQLMLEHSPLLHLPQFLLASEAISPAVAGISLRYLMDRIHEVGTADVKKSRTLLRMFKLSFMAVMLFPVDNEQVVHPHVTKIISKCIEYSVTAEEPMNYFLLLRSLFRSIGGGRYETLYKELLPLLEMLLETFNNLILDARKPVERDLYVELTLTVPARLSHLLPHLSHLMRPIVVALRSGSDLVGQGLRTLELCVDNLTADYLDPIMAPIVDELMSALWEHLRPNPYNHFHAHTTMRILGKLGGRNRKFLNHPPDLTFQQFADDVPSMDIKLIGSSKERAFPLDIGIDLALGKLLESATPLPNPTSPANPEILRADSFYKQQAFRLLSSQLKLYIGYEQPPDDWATLLRLQANDLAEGKFTGVDIMEKFDRKLSVKKKLSQENTLKKLLKGCIVAATIPELKQEASAFLTDVCRHFTIIEVGRSLASHRHMRRPFNVSIGDGPLFLDTKTLADAVVECLSSENPDIRDAAKQVIFSVHEFSGIIFGSPEKGGKLPFLSHLARILCHACHDEEWFTKSGGALGIHIFVTELGLTTSWLVDRQTEFIRALMYVIKDTPSEFPGGTRMRAQKTIDIILKKCNQGVSKDELQNERSRILVLCGLLSYELSHMNKHVRQAAQSGIATLAETLQAEVYELITPVKDRLLMPIFNKPLRALPFPTQIGCIEAITYCLGLRQNIVTFNDQLNRLLMESLALADVDDESLAAKPNEFKTAEQIINLRVSCLRLLSMAMKFPDFASGPQSQGRARIISVFFKSLYARSQDIIEAANSGLRDVLTQTNKLPKDLLQNGLRPILMNLQDPKRLSVAGLDGLARLLTLLTNYFKVEIGSRLLDHMRVIADENTLQKGSFGLIEQIPAMKIVAAIFNIFHLLPPAATSFMENLVNKVLSLEERLRRTSSSPFRKPLLKFLNRYPKESWAFFLARLHDEKYGRFFAQLLADPESVALRQIVFADPETLISTAFPEADSTTKNTTSINGIYVVHSVVSHQETGGWLKSHPELKRHLLNAGKDLHAKLKADKLQTFDRLRVEQAQDQLLAIFTGYLHQSLDDVDFLFEVLDKVSDGELKPSLIALPNFLYNNIITNSTFAYRRSIVVRCLDLYGQRNASQMLKSYAFRYLVNPIFLVDVQTNWNVETTDQRLLDRAMVDHIHNRLWKPQLGDLAEETGQIGVDHSRMELLQLSALLIKYHHKVVQESRKDIIKFAWSYIRLEDIINKYGAYVLISYFIAHYETPSKIVIQIYGALLRAHQTDGKSLVTQALEILAPVLPKRVTQGQDPRSPLWARYPRRILTEETANLQQVMSIFQFLVRQPDLFYESRENFIPLIIPSLVKIVNPSNPASMDSRKLVLNLINLIWVWEDKRVKSRDSLSPSQTKARLTTQSPSPAPPPRERVEYAIPMDLRASLVKYLVSFICVLPARFAVPTGKLRELISPKAVPTFPTYGDMAKDAIQLLRHFCLLENWYDVDIELYAKIFDGILCCAEADKPDEKLTTTMINALQSLRILLAAKPNSWIVEHTSTIQNWFDKALRLDNPEVQECLHSDDHDVDLVPKVPPPIHRVLEALPQEEQTEEDAMEIDSGPTEFVIFLSAAATEAMSVNNYLSGINILWTLSKTRPAEMDQHIPHVMKIFSQKLAKDHVASYSNTTTLTNGRGYNARVNEQTPSDHRDLEIGVDLISKTIDLISARMSSLGDQRRPFLSVLAQLVERSQSVNLCTKILGMVEHWIFHSTESWPTLKEKTAVLHKMLLFESRADPTMLGKFLELVIRVYEDPKITRTELTVRLEHAFLVGTRARDVDMRSRFMTIFDRSLTRSANTRLSYVLTSQNWDTLADSFWLAQASHLVMGSVDMTASVRMDPDDFTIPQASFLFGHSENDPAKENIVVDNHLETLITEHKKFYLELGDVKARDILEPLTQLQHADPEVAYKVWVSLYTICWASLTRDEQLDLEKGMVSLLTREYHLRQIDERPNVIQALLEGVTKARPRFKIPPHVMKFLSRTYDTWYTAAVSLEQYAINPIIDTPVVRESNLDALVEIYAGLQEDDMFYGTWRRRCKFVETNAALSYEQQGMWDKAQQLYESAQLKARTGAIPFSQAEYYLWEDHWLICAQKLQQWEILTDFAKHENFNDLLLESTWRTLDNWQGDTNREQIESLIKSVSDAPTPRRTFFQAFLSLLKFHSKQDTLQEFNTVCDESVQLSIRKWHQLPKRITNAHVPILQNFQQLVELHDASVICTSLAQTTERNMDTKSAELKLLLTTWRDRLPNVWDDINAWQDIVTWRQHVFQLINGTYLNLLPPQSSSVASNSYAYRGYHETAWIINRFAHVARKHQMPEVCITQLSRIYTLPNIEIQEAFLKLREQAKCHYQNPKELNSGLDVINNTNLGYFNSQQKAEFYTLKGMFLGKLDHNNEANEAFGVALFYDLRLAKAWAEWGQYSDQRFKSDPTDIEQASNALSCYLEAAGLYKSHKSRRLLSRILWLLSQDNDEGKIAAAFENFKGDTPVWYWITFIPQLLTSLSHREGRLCRAILGKIAKLYPQSLFFLLRTSREDFINLKKAQEQKQEKINRLKASASPSVKNGSPDVKPVDPAASSPSGAGSPARPPVAPTQPPTSRPASAGDGTQRDKQSWEYAEDIMAGLKTAFPLLALTMETMVDQVQKHFKCPADEDAYRLIVALLNDGLSYVSRVPTSYAQDCKLPPSTEANITRFAETILPAHLRKSFETDFVVKKPTMYEYIHKLRKWRDKLEEKLDRRPPYYYLESYSAHLSEFKFMKFDEVEVPGQYLEHKDKNQDFVRIDRFLPNVDLVRGIGVCHRRLRIRGHDGSLHIFAVQHPAARHCRREERMMQLFRIFNSVLMKRKESRRRNIYFHLPLMIPLAPHIRLVKDDPSYTSLQGIYEDHCRLVGMARDEPVLFTMGKMRALAESKTNVSTPTTSPAMQSTNNQQRAPEHSAILKTEIFDAIQKKWVPNSILLEWIQSIYPNFADFWLFRRQFSYQYAAIAFMTYIMHIGNRYPSKIHISRRTGDVWSSELIPAMNPARAIFYNPEQVPFRLTPNIQTLMGPLATEGIFACAIMAIARCITEPKLELEQQLSIFVRDELVLWASAQQRVLQQLRDMVQNNIDYIVNRAVSLTSSPDGNLPANQSVVDLISRAVNPQNLAQCDALWMPYM